MGSDPLVRLGQQDISAHVDLRTLVRLAIAAGLRAGATAQRGLLLNLGFQQVLAQLPGPTDRQALAGLVDPDGLGGQIAARVPDARPARLQARRRRRRQATGPSRGRPVAAARRGRADVPEPVARGLSRAAEHEPERHYGRR